MNKKELKRFIVKNQMNILIGLISIIAFIIGIFAIGFLKSFLIVGIIDLLLFAPNILHFIKKRKKNGKTNLKKTNKNSNLAISSKKETTPIKTKKQKRKKKKKKILKRVIIVLLILFIILCIAACVVAGIFFSDIAKNAPKFDPHRLDRQESSIVYGADGSELLKVGTQKREKITYDQMPEVLINAIVATEDSRFFKHNGFDLPRFLKASIKQVLGKGGGGASTLTMQVSKNNYTSKEKEGIEGIKRKFTDIYMAMFKLEKQYTKEQILEFYVNDNYLGGSSYGVEQACLTYFGKHAKDINLAEAAMIAGLFQSPGAYDPFVNPEVCEQRRQTVLYLMERHGYITSEERAIAKKMTVEKILNPSAEGTATDSEYMQFINMVFKEIENDLGTNPYSTPMKIYTTLNKDKQDKINQILKGETFHWENPVVDAGVAMIDTKTGAIHAISGGRHHMKEAAVNNYATKTHQIGSTAKPLYDYGPAVEYKNWSTGELIVDEEHGYSSGGTVNNWDLKYMGMMTIQDALRMSRNIPAIKTFQSLTNKEILDFTSKLHLSPEVEGGIIHEAHSIGGYNGESPLTLAAAYNAFANGGYYITPHSYTKIELRETGEVIEKKVEKTRAMSEETAYIMMHMLMETPSYALGGYSVMPGVTYGAKTGTTNFPTSAFEKYNLPYGAINDLWVVGSSPDYTISLWYGYTDGIKEENVKAGYISKLGNHQHEKLYQALGKALFETGTTFKKPDGVIEVAIEKESYPLSLPSEYTPESMITTALFKKGTEPTEKSTRFAPLGDISNLKATSSGNKVTLTWNAASIPNTATAEGLNALYKPLFKTEQYLNSYVGSRIGYNNSYMGNVEYHIYRKNNDGSLTLMEKTTDTKITFTDKSAGNNTYVVKTSYSIFTVASSNGVETKVTVEASGNDDNDKKPDNNNDHKDDDKNDDDKKPADGEISILLNGNKNIKISQNKKFDETGLSYIMVTERIDGILVDVTRSANTTISHEVFDYSNIGASYPVSIKVTYKGKTKIIELIVTIE